MIGKVSTAQMRDREFDINVEHVVLYERNQLIAENRTKVVRLSHRHYHIDIFYQYAGGV